MAKVCYKLYNYPRLTPNKYPTNAVNPIAAVPQNAILIIAFFIFEPPVLAAKIPRKMRKIIAKLYREYSIFFNGKKRVAKSGRTPPTVKDAPDAKAA